MAGRSLKEVIHKCAAKRRFESLEEVRAAQRPGLSSYRCVACNGFHLTSQGPELAAREASDERKPTYETSVLGRARGVSRKGNQAEDRRLVDGECVSKPKPNGFVIVRVEEKQYETTEPVQPAQLRTLLKAGTKVRVELKISPRLVRISGVI